MFSVGQFTTIFREDYQLVQMEVLCYLCKHLRYLDLHAATIGEFEFCSQNLFIFRLILTIKSLFFLTTDRQGNICSLGMCLQ